MRNLLTDIPGVAVGHATDMAIGTGVTAILFDEPAIASGVILGGAPGSRDTALLEPEMTQQRVSGFVLSGGSLFGLDAAGGVQAWLRENKRGIADGNTSRANDIGIDAKALVHPLRDSAEEIRAAFAFRRQIYHQAALGRRDDFKFDSAERQAPPDPVGRAQLGLDKNVRTECLAGGLQARVLRECGEIG